MRLERHPIRVSHETIYRFAYSKDGREEQFYRYLPEHRRRRRPRQIYLTIQMLCMLREPRRHAIILVWEG